MIFDILQIGSQSTSPSSVCLIGALRPRYCFLWDDSS